MNKKLKILNKQSLKLSANNSLQIEIVESKFKRIKLTWRNHHLKKILNISKIKSCPIKKPNMFYRNKTRI